MCYFLLCSPDNITTNFVSLTVYELLLCCRGSSVPKNMGEQRRKFGLILRYPHRYPLFPTFTLLYPLCAPLQHSPVDNYLDTDLHQLNTDIHR